MTLSKAASSEPHMRNYSIFYKQSFLPGEDWEAGLGWDFYLSAYNESARITSVFASVPAADKQWIIHPEYGFAAEALPAEARFTSASPNEADFVRDLITDLRGRGFDPTTSTLCIDITGLLRPHLLFLVRMLEIIGVRRFHAIYSEPDFYKKKGATSFSGGSVSAIRQVAGYEGIGGPDTQADRLNDLLIIGMGFDAELIKEVAEDKDKADKIQFFGLPSLRADMYQQSVLRSREVADLLADPQFSPRHRVTAPANDPFVTATMLSEVVKQRETRTPFANLYLCPLGTKVQALGFALFYLGECLGTNRSIIFPFSTRYSPETTEGLSRVWLYTVEFPLFDGDVGSS
jgi:hypothetical protein